MQKFQEYAQFFQLLFKKFYEKMLKIPLICSMKNPFLEQILKKKTIF